MKTTQVTASITRLKKMIAQLADGLNQSDATDVMLKINAATLKLGRAGWTAIADEFQAKKTAALAAGEVARAARYATEIARLKDEERQAKREDPAAWMVRR